MATISHQVWINASAAEVYNAVTTRQGLAGWWLECVVELKIGYVMEFLIDGHLHNRMKITSLAKDQYVAWKCINNIGEWKDTRLSFSISEKKDAVILNFKHDGWKTASDFYSVCNFHWARHLLMLKALCETGQPQINKQTELDWGLLAQKLM